MSQTQVLGGSATLTNKRRAHEFDWSIGDARALLQLDAQEWDHLSEESLVENPFYARSYLLAGLGRVERKAGKRALVMRSPGAGIVGLFPFRNFGIAPFNVARGAANIYQASGAPLSHRRHGARVIAQFVDLLAAGRIAPLFILRHIDMSSVFATSLMQEARRAGLIVEETHRYDRPKLTRMEGGFDNHIDTVLSRSRAKDLQRNLRRLKEIGTVSFERVDCPETVDRRLEEFLRIEHSGWKGARRTSFLANPRHAAFARLAYGGTAGLSVIDSLLLDGKPIAVSINMASGTTNFTPKCAYDETYKRFSPGLLLEYFVIKAFYEDKRWEQMDSATGIQDHIIGGFWNDTMPMADLALAPDTVRGRLAVATHRQTLNGISIAKTMRDRYCRRG